jgi:hypothetical protein
VLVDPAETRRIRTDFRLYTFAKPGEHGERVFQGSRACPVEVGPIFEDEGNVRPVRDTEFFAPFSGNGSTLRAVACSLAKTRQFLAQAVLCLSAREQLHRCNSGHSSSQTVSLRKCKSSRDRKKRESPLRGAPNNAVTIAYEPGFQRGQDCDSSGNR